MGPRIGGGANVRAHNAIKASIERLADHFPVSPGGYFGDPGKSSKGRTIASVDPYATAEKFWRLLKGNLRDVRTANGNGSRVDFPVLSVAVYRRITSTKGSPGVTLTIKTSGLGVTGYQRIHFIKKGVDK